MIERSFAVEGGHTFVSYRLPLEPGDHRVVIRADTRGRPTNGSSPWVLSGATWRSRTWEAIRRHLPHSLSTSATSPSASRDHAGMTALVAATCRASLVSCQGHAGRFGPVERPRPRHWAVVAHDAIISNPGRNPVGFRRALPGSALRSRASAAEDHELGPLAVVVHDTNEGPLGRSPGDATAGLLGVSHRLPPEPARPRRGVPPRRHHGRRCR